MIVFVVVSVVLGFVTGVVIELRLITPNVVTLVVVVVVASSSTSAKSYHGSSGARIYNRCT